MTTGLIPSLLAACLGQAGPGAIAVVDGDVTVVTFELPDGTPYQLDYPTTLCSLWFDQAKTLPAAPLTTYMSESRGDINGDGKFDGGDIRCFAMLLTPPVAQNECIHSSEADFDGSGSVDLNDIPGFIEALLGGYPADGAVLFVEGIAPSTSLGDAAIDLLTDPDMDLIFTVAETRPTTIVDLTFSPLSGPLGTPVTITMTPAISPLAFDASTTASWSGQFEPLMGSAPPSFTVAYSSPQVQEQSMSQAIIVVGDGAASSLPDATSFGTTGQVVGTVTITFDGVSVQKNVTFGFQISGEWHRIHYDTDGTTSVGAIADGMWIYVISLTNPTFSLAELPNALWYFRTFLLRVDENSTTLATAPDTLDVVLVTVDSGGTLVDQEPVILLKVLGDDGDPANIVYHTDLDNPVILVDSDVNKDDYPDLTILRAATGGHVIATP